ncbi:MAG: ferredoxin [Acidobacteria bacterium]|nr:ferredoxin [Acidobacteriota bacterium]
MADPTSKMPENEQGAFYVDSQCIDCDICREIAPYNFTRETKKGYSYVYKQPDNARELELCREAMSSCPVDAIGNNG